VAFFLAAFVNGRLMKRLYDVTRRYKKSAESELYLINAKEDLRSKLNDALKNSEDSLRTLIESTTPDSFYIGMYSVKMKDGYRLCYILYAHFSLKNCDVAIKNFATGDEAYNKMAAEELLEKLNEKL
jgi:hypothetical protein